MRSIRKRNPLNPPLVCVVGFVGMLLCGARSGGPHLSAAPVPEPEAKRAVPLPFPDGVSDSTYSTAFVSSLKGGLQAVRLEDGRVLWTNDECQAEPWLVAGDRLIARGERLVVLDLKHEGKQVLRCDAPTFPKVEIPDRCTVAFNLWNPHVSGNALEARWYAVAQIDRSKGRPFPFQAWTAFNKAVPVGTVKVNLETGKSEVQTDPKPADVTMGLIPEAIKPDRVPAVLPEKLVPVWQQYHKDQNGRITILDGRLVGVLLNVEKTGAEYQKRVILSAWDIKTGAAAEPVELIKGKALDIANVALTEDHRHAAVQFSDSALAIYSLTSGKIAAKELKGVSSPEHAFVDRKRLYHVARMGNAGEQALRALALEDGKVVWERAIRSRSTIPLPP
jgi:hypothetical protein